MQVQAQPLAVTAPPTAATPPTSASEIPNSDKYQAKLEWSGGKLRIEPVPVSYEPKISKDQAFEAFKEHDLFSETAGSQVADVSLGLYSNDEMNVTGPTAIYFNRPVWVIRYDNVPDETGQSTNRLVFVDADTGEYLDTVDDSVDIG